MKVIDESSIKIAELLSRIDDLEREVKKKTQLLEQMSAESRLRAYQGG